MVYTNKTCRFREGVARCLLMLTARTYICDVVYTPQAVLKALDLAGGVCSLQAYQVIYAIDLMSKDPYKKHKEIQFFHTNGELDASPKDTQIL